MPRPAIARWISARIARWASARAQMNSSTPTSGGVSVHPSRDTGHTADPIRDPDRTNRRGRPMDDNEVLHRINALAEEEEQLWSRASEHGGLTAEDDARLQVLQVALDQAYDLLAQRRARRSA